MTNAYHARTRRKARRDRLAGMVRVPSQRVEAYRVGELLTTKLAGLADHDPFATDAEIDPTSSRLRARETRQAQQAERDGFRGFMVDGPRTADGSTAASRKHGAPTDSHLFDESGNLKPRARGLGARYKRPTSRGSAFTGPRSRVTGDTGIAHGATAPKSKPVSMGAGDPAPARSVAADTVLPRTPLREGSDRARSAAWLRSFLLIWSTVLTRSSDSTPVRSDLSGRARNPSWILRSRARLAFERGRFTFPLRRRDSVRGGGHDI